MSTNGFKVSKTLIVLFILLLPLLLALLIIVSPILLLAWAVSRYYDYREHCVNVKEKAKLKRFEVAEKKNLELEKIRLKVDYYNNNKIFKNG